MSECTHGRPLHEACNDCLKEMGLHSIDSCVPTQRPDVKEEDKPSLHAQTNVLLQKLIELQGVMLETMANLAHKVETIEDALKERIIAESDKLEYQTRDSGREAEEAGYCYCAVHGRKRQEGCEYCKTAEKVETFTKESAENYKGMTGFDPPTTPKTKWSYCHKHMTNFEWEKGDCPSCITEKKTLFGFDPYGDKDQ